MRKEELREGRDRRDEKRRTEGVQPGAVGAVKEEVESA